MDELIENAGVLGAFCAGARARTSLACVVRRPLTALWSHATRVVRFPGIPRHLAEDNVNMEPVTRSVNLPPSPSPSCLCVCYYTRILLPRRFRGDCWCLCHRLSFIRVICFGYDCATCFFDRTQDWLSFVRSFWFFVYVKRWNCTNNAITGRVVMFYRVFTINDVVAKLTCAEKLMLHERTTRVTQL